MIHEKLITTSTAYTSTSKLETVWKLEAGMITQLRVYFPDGCKGTHKLQILREGSQIFPKTTGHFCGNEVLIDFDDVNYPLTTEPYELRCLTWLEDGDFSHNVYIMLNISSFLGLAE